MFGYILAVIFGFLTGVTLSVLLLAKRIRKTVRDSSLLDYSEDISANFREGVDSVIKEQEKLYRDSTRFSVLFNLLGIKRKKKNGEGVDYYKIIQSVAKIFNPDSKTPMLELNERQAFAFGHDVVKHLTEIIDASGIPFLGSVKLSLCYGSAKVITKVTSNKVVGVFSNGFNTVLKIINIINPLYWVKKLITQCITVACIKEIMYASIEIVGKEFANLYYSAELEDADATLAV